MLLTYLDDLARTIKRHRRQGWGWRYDGLNDWSTERIFEQLRDIGIDTDEQRFPQQAATAGRFKPLNEDWVRQIPKKKSENGFWRDFPLISIPVLWDRLAPQTVCADLIEEHLYRAIKAEEDGVELAHVDGLPADIAVGLELARFLQAVEPAERSARFDEVNDGRYYDYFDWISELIESRGAQFPDAVTQIADAMFHCCDGDLLQSDLAMALALAGRHEEAISRTRANIERSADRPWVHILAGDVFEELGDDTAAIRQWIEALPLAADHDEWTSAADRLEEAFDRAGRRGELEAILNQHPDPDPAPLPEYEPALRHNARPQTSFPVGPPARLEFESEAPRNFGPIPRLTRAATVGRNDPCPCGSGKKYKKCCIHVAAAQ
jgi:tetratricopeptide (TPR) repeat protein